jgi:hypothetical protein
VRANPTAFSTASLRLEYDAQLGQLQGLNVTGNTNYRSAQTTVGWSTRRSFDDEMDNALSGSTTMRLLDGRTGGSFFIDWDIRRQYIIQHRWIGFYNAQCCGITMEYQEFNFSNDPRFLVPKDRRFNIGFTLAGIGTFSNFFGTFGGSR